MQAHVALCQAQIHDCLSPRITALGATVQSAQIHSDLLLFDISGVRDGKKWFCFSITLILRDFSMGVWTKEMNRRLNIPKDITRTYVYNPATFNQWLDGWFEDAVLEELTKP